MSEVQPATLRHSYARRIAQLADTRNARIEQAFSEIPRETFLPPSPWTVISLGDVRQTDELADIYDNVLVAIDRKRGINNGEPALHAGWLDAVSPQPGDHVIHVGAGTGYYTALLARLVDPGGSVEAFEYESDLADIASRNLQPYANVVVHSGSAFGRELSQADIIYVNAGVTAPDPKWLKALKRGGRLVFPWQPHGGWGPALLVTRQERGFAVHFLMNVGFISCSGAAEKLKPRHRLTETAATTVRSVWLTGDAAPDRSAVAIYEHVWFSSMSLG